MSIVCVMFLYSTEMEHKILFPFLIFLNYILPRLLGQVFELNPVLILLESKELRFRTGKNSVRKNQTQVVRIGHQHLFMIQVGAIMVRAMEIFTRAILHPMPLMFPVPVEIKSSKNFMNLGRLSHQGRMNL